MTEDESSGEGVYRFDLVVGASVAIVATQGRSARDAVMGALEGAAAKLSCSLAGRGLDGMGGGRESQKLQVDGA